MYFIQDKNIHIAKCVAWWGNSVNSVVQMQNKCSPITNNMRHNLATGDEYMMTH